MAGIDTANAVLLVGALLVLAGILSGLAARRFGAPLLLVFLVVGMLAGEDGPGGIVFNDYGMTFLVASLALAVILFDGGLRTKLARFRGALAPSILLATLGVTVTSAAVGAAGVSVLGLTWPEGFLLGAIVASTDAAAVFFLLRAGGLRLRPRIGSVLEIESGTNDPFAMFLVIVLTEIVLTGGGVTWNVFFDLARQSAVGAALGLAGGVFIVALLNRLALPSGLHPLLAIGGAVAVYALTSLADGSGFLAVYLAGLVVGNRPVRAYPTIASFHLAATWLCQIVMFVVLGLLVTPTRMATFLAPAFAVALVLMLVARPVAVALCLAPFGFSTREIGFVAWVGLRGAVSVFLAAIPTLAALPDAAVYFNVAFVVVLVSLVVQGWTIGPAARWLGVALAGTEPAVSRVELDLPGQIGHELVGYPIRPGSLVLARGRIPDGTRLMLVIRDGAVLDPAVSSPLVAGDYAYLLAEPDRVHRLDRQFAEGGASDSPAGEFGVNGQTSLAALAAFYGLALTGEERELTVAALFAARFDGAPDLGDAAALDACTLVARDIADGRVVRAGLQLPDLTPIEAAALRWRHVKDRVRGFARRVRTRIRAPFR